MAILLSRTEQYRENIVKQHDRDEDFNDQMTGYWFSSFKMAKILVEVSFILVNPFSQEKKQNLVVLSSIFRLLNKAKFGV